MNRLLTILILFCLRFGSDALGVDFGVELQAQQTVGVFINDSSAFEGYTLFCPLNSKITYLIDNCGRRVHTWESEYFPGISVYLLDDGRLLHTAKVPLTSGGGNGGRVEIFSWDGDLLWHHDFADNNFTQHHDVEYLPNGNILVLGRKELTTEEAIALGRDSTTLENSGEFGVMGVLEVRPTDSTGAEIVWEWQLKDHLVQDFDSTQSNFDVVGDHPELMDANYFRWDEESTHWNHANAVAYNEALDQIMVSLRHQHEFLIIDHSTTTAQAASHSGGIYGQGGDILYRWGNPAAYRRGDTTDQQLFGQHDAHWIEDGLKDGGKVLLYNNGRTREPHFSQIDVIPLPVDSNGFYPLPVGGTYEPLEAQSSYTADDPTDLYSSGLGGVQRLPNGNTLICEGGSGHIFEIDSQKHIVWDYVSPVVVGGAVSQGNATNGNGVFRAYRYGIDYPAFAGRDLTPGTPIEFNPLPPISPDCAYGTGIGNDLSAGELVFAPNPFKEKLACVNDRSMRLFVKIYHITGRLYFKGWVDPGKTLILPSADWPSGLYVAGSQAENGVPLSSRVLIKN